MQGEGAIPHPFCVQSTEIILIAQWQVGNNVKKSQCGKMWDRKKKTKTLLVQVFRKIWGTKPNSLGNHLFLKKKWMTLSIILIAASYVLIPQITWLHGAAFQNNRQLETIKTAGKKIWEEMPLGSLIFDKIWWIKHHIWSLHQTFCWQNITWCDTALNSWQFETIKFWHSATFVMVSLWVIESWTLQCGLLFLFFSTSGNNIFFQCVNCLFNILSEPEVGNIEIKWIKI